MVNLRLQSARADKGWTQEQLAHHAGVSVATVSRAEQGDSPRRATMAVLALALGRDRAWLWPTAQAIERRAA